MEHPESLFTSKELYGGFAIYAKAVRESLFPIVAPLRNRLRHASRDAGMFRGINRVSANFVNALVCPLDCYIRCGGLPQPGAKWPPVYQVDSFD